MNNPTPQQIPLTYEALMASIYDSNRFLTEKFAETDRILSEKFAENERLLNESRIKSEKEFEKSEKRMKKLEDLLGSWANNFGSFAEEYFFNSFENEQQNFFCEHFNKIRKNLKMSWKNIEDEYDIVMYNDSSVAIVEVKSKAHKNDVQEVMKKAETFRILCPDYSDYNIYLGLASLSFYEEVEQECIKQGIAIIKQVGDTVVINDEHLKRF